jgi:uncharacterized protein (DUF1499 family)
MKKFLIVLLLLVVAIAGLGFYRTFTPPGDLRVSTQQFSACPSRPSCVSSVAKDETHAIEPLKYEGTAEQAKAALSAVIAAMPGTRIEHDAPDYIHAVFVTPTMHYHDDVELLIRPDGVIDVRSISRFGYGDQGVNRKRVEEIRARFEEAKAAPGSAS